MQLKSQVDIDWAGWSFLWILNRQRVGICLRLHFYELTRAPDIASATRLKKCQPVYAARAHARTHTHSWMVKRMCNMICQWVISFLILLLFFLSVWRKYPNELKLHFTFFLSGFQYYFYVDSVIIRCLALWACLNRRRQSWVQGFEERSRTGQGLWGMALCAFCSNTWFIASFGPRL